MDAEFIEIKNLAEKEVARRRKTTVEMVTKYDDFPGGRVGSTSSPGPRQAMSGEMSPAR